MFRHIKDLLLTESLILAQNERWRRGLGMQVERSSSELSGELVSTSWVTFLKVGDNIPKGVLIPHVVSGASVSATKAAVRFQMGPTPISLLVR